MKTISLRTLVREPRKVKRMTRTGQPVQVTDNGDPLWILQAAPPADTDEEERVDCEQTRREILKELDPNSEFKGPFKVEEEMAASAKPSPLAPQASAPSHNFTPRAQQVLALARKEADRLNHNFVGTEHLLIGLIKLGQGVAVTVLQKLGLDLESVREEVEKRLGTGPDKVIAHIPYAPHVKKVLALAVREAKALHHPFVGTEHILLGLLREGDGGAARIMQHFNVDINQTRQEILKKLAGLPGI